MAARLAAWALVVGRNLALVGKAIPQAGRQQVGRILEIFVVTLGLAGQQNVHAVMQVVRPLRVKARRIRCGPQQRRTVVLMLQHKVDLPPWLDP